MKTLLAIFSALLLFGAGVLLAPRLQLLLAPLGQSAAKPAAADAAAPRERQPVKYRHPMNPAIFSDTPAKDDMGMDYIPVYADDGKTDTRPGIRIAPEVVNNLGVRTAPVERGDLSRRIETVGYLDYDERALSHVHLRANGWVENLKVRTLGERVRKGDLLLEVYAPDLVNAQKEYLQALGGLQESLKVSARDRLLALGVSESQVQQVEKERRVPQWTAVYARQDGIVSALNIRQGMYVTPEMELMTLADVSTVWVKVEVFEQQTGWLAVGQKAEVRLPHAPGEAWEGTVEYIYPDVDPKTRAVRARLRFPNPGERLKFNMFADVVVHATPRARVLHIPREALIRTGVEQRVIVELGNGRFEARPVETGHRGRRPGGNPFRAEGRRAGSHLRAVPARLRKQRARQPATADCAREAGDLDHGGDQYRRATLPHAERDPRADPGTELAGHDHGFSHRQGREAGGA